MAFRQPYGQYNYQEVPANNCVDSPKINFEKLYHVHIHIVFRTTQTQCIHFCIHVIGEYILSDAHPLSVK